jgi:hypothetical protein
MLANTHRAQVLEYSILHNTKPMGPPIGKLAGNDFSEIICDEFDRLFVFSGVAPRRSNGQFDEDALKKGEFIVPPGLIYKYRGKARGRAA